MKSTLDRNDAKIGRRKRTERFPRLAWPLLLAPAIGLAGWASALQSTPQPNSASSLIAVDVVNDGSSIELSTKPATPAYKTFTLHNPERWVIDMSGTTDQVHPTTWSGSRGKLKGIRVGQFTPDVARVVLDLAEPTPIEVKPDSHGIALIVGAKSDKNAPVPARSGLPGPNANTSLAAPQLPLPNLSNVDLPPSPRPTLMWREAVLPMKPPEIPLAAIQNLIADIAPPALAAFWPESATPESGFDSPQIVPPAQPSDAASSSAPATPAPAPLSVAKSSGQDYTGERVSLNLKDADLQDFFRMIHEVSGLNVVLDPNVKGNLTVALNDVPWDQALEIVLRNYQLGKQVEGNVVRIATLKTLDEERKSANDLVKARQDAEPLVTTYRTLSYTKAADVAALLNSSKPQAPSGPTDTNANAPAPVAAGLLCTRCQITADPRTNTLVIQSPPDFIPELDALLTKLDRKTQQLEVDARIVSTTSNFSRELGVQLGIGTGTSTTSVGGNPALGFSPNVVNGLNPVYPTSSGTIPFNVNLGANAPTSGLGFINATNSYRIDAVLSAAEQKGKGKIISQPQIMTQNNTPGFVQQGVKIPVQTTINNTISVQFFNVVLKLTVTPQITADGNVFLTVDVVNDQIDPGIPPISGIPAIDTQETTTNVLVGNGETVVVGGVMVHNNATTVQQVPLLGDVPLVGNLFKHNSVQSTDQELMFFLTPKVLNQ